MKVDALLEYVEGEMNDINSLSGGASVEDSVSVLLTEFPKVNIVFNTISEALRGLLGLVMENKIHSENIVIELMKGLQQNLSSIFGSIGDLNSEPEVVRCFGNSLSSAMGGLARSVIGIQEELGLDGEEERPLKKAKLSDRITVIETFLPKLGTQMMSLVNEMRVLKHSQPSPPVEQVEGPFGIGMPEEKESYLAQCLSEAMSRLTAMERSLKTMEAKSEPGSGGERPFTINGHDFTELKSAMAFLNNAGAYGETCGYYFDAFSLGTYCQRSDSDRSVEEQAAATKAGLGNTMTETAILYSFRLDRPPQFGAEREIVRSTNPKIPTFVLPHVKSLEDMFSPVSYGKQSVVTSYDKGYERIMDSLNDLRSKAMLEPRARAVFEVATEMNRATNLFIHSLHTEFERFFRRVTADSLCTTDDEAWALISEMIAAILFEVCKARTKGYGTDIPKGEEQVGKVLSSTFSAHVKMNEIMVAGFTKHVCVTPALSLHLYLRKASIHSIIEWKEFAAKMEKRLAALESLQAVGRAEMDKKFADHKNAYEGKMKAVAGGKKS